MLEPLAEAHAEALFEVLSDPAIYAFEGGPPPSVAALANGIRRKLAGVSPDGREVWLNWVVRRPDGRLAGYVQATVFPSGTAQVGYEFASAHWRQGIGSAAVGAVLQELARAHAVHTVVAVLKAANFRSLGLLAKLGFAPGRPADPAAAESEADEVVRVLSVRALPRADGPQGRGPPPHRPWPGDTPADAV